MLETFTLQHSKKRLLGFHGMSNIFIDYTNYPNYPPVIEPENYAVAFFYRAMDGAYHCAPPRLLSDFAAQ